jgi:hypothetical protein
VPFEQRGKIMDENLDILKRFWTEHTVSGKFPHHDIPAGVMFPKPVQKPHPADLDRRYVDRVLKRAATVGDGWLTYFYRPEAFAKSWGKIRDFAKEGGKDPDKLLNASQLPIMIGKSRQAVEGPMMEWLTKEWDFAAWSESTKDSAIMGRSTSVSSSSGAPRGGNAEAYFVPYKYQKRADRDHRPRDHSAAETLSAPHRRSSTRRYSSGDPRGIPDSLRQTGAELAGRNNPARGCSVAMALCSTVAAQFVSADRQCRACLRRNGHPSSNGWPNFVLASFLDAYYHPKNRTIPAPRRMSAGPAMDRPASPMPLAPQTAGLSSTNVSSSSRSDRAGWLSNRKHTSSSEDDGSEDRHEEVCSDGGKPVGCRAGREAS